MKASERKRLEKQYIAFIKAGGAATLADFIATATAGKGKK